VECNDEENDPFVCDIRRELRRKETPDSRLLFTAMNGSEECCDVTANTVKQRLLILIPKQPPLSRT
jgi:hypothetical protein